MGTTASRPIALDPARRRAAAPDRRERRKRELRERIYASARRLFAEKGFAATTVDEIAAAADVAPATFFNHFEGKRALLGLMTSEVVEHLEELIGRHFRERHSARERLDSFARAAAERIGAHRGVARDVVLELMRAEARPEEAAPYLDRVHEPVEAMLREGQLAGEVRRDLAAAFLAQMVVGMLNAPIARWLSDPGHPVERELPRAADFAWDAIKRARENAEEKPPCK